MKTKLALISLCVVLSLPLLAGCGPQYPGDPVADPKAERKLPDGSTPAPRVRPAERSEGR